MPAADSLKNVMANAAAGAITHLALLTALSDTAPTEVTGGSPAYARKATTAWTSAAAGITTTPSVAVTFDVPASTTVLAIGFYTAVTAGTFHGWSPLNGVAATQGFGVVDATGVTNDTITSSVHGLTTDDYIVVNNVAGTAIPAGLTETTQTYRVLASGLTADVFKLSLTSGGAAVNITGQGELWFQKLIPEVYGAQGTLAVAINAVTLDLNAV